LSQVVLGGRQELGRLQGPDLTAQRPAVSGEIATAPSPARRATSRLRRAVGRGLAS
jgi:hypothetical protein